MSSQNTAKSFHVCQKFYERSKLSIGFATVLSGSCVYTIFNDKEWKWFFQSFPASGNIPLQFQKAFPTGLYQVLGSLVSHFPKQSLDLAQSDHFYVRSLMQQVLGSAEYPPGFDLKHVLEVGSKSILISLARNLRSDDNLFPFENKVVVQDDYDNLKKAFCDLLSYLPTSGKDSCTEWFTTSAFRGGKSAHHLYTTISLASEDETDLESAPIKIAVRLFLKALCKHSEVPKHRCLIIEHNGLDLLQVISETYSEANITKLLSCLLGNIALDETSHEDIINKGWLPQLRRWVKSEDITIRNNALRALANLDREGERGYIYEDGIFVVYPTKQLKCCKPDIDLVFIHGLGGNPFTTWRSNDEIFDEKQRTKCWPGDWLPRDLPNCRVIMVKYSSELSDWTSKCPLQPEMSSIEYRSSELIRKLVNAGVGQRPVIWVSHSMGGLLVKQLLKDASKTRQFRQLTNKTSAVVFYSVPHKGSDVASLVSGRARFVLRPSFEVKELQKGSELLENLHHDFLKCIDKKDINVLSYGETEPAKIVNRDALIVPRESADFGVGEFVELPTNHFNVCKPTSVFDPCYFKTVEFVQKHLETHDTDHTALLF